MNMNYWKIYQTPPRHLKGKQNISLQEQHEIQFFQSFSYSLFFQSLFKNITNKIISQFKVQGCPGIPQDLIAEIFDSLVLHQLKQYDKKSRILEFLEFHSNLCHISKRSSNNILKKKKNKCQADSPQQDDGEEFELPDSDREIYSIKKIANEPLCIKNARLFMNEPQTITKIHSQSYQSIPTQSISPLRVRSQISPTLGQLVRGKKKSKKTVPIQRITAQSPGILKASNSQKRTSRSGSQKRVTFNLDTSILLGYQAFGQIKKKKKNTMNEMLRQF